MLYLFYVIIRKKLKQIAQLHGHTKRHGQVLLLDVHAKKRPEASGGVVRVPGN